MSITDIALGYLWFVLAATCILYARRFFHPEVRESWDKFKRTWRDPESDEDRLRVLESDFSQVEAGIARLLRSGFDEAILVVQNVGFERFIQFRKYIRDVGDFGIELGFPDVAWSQKYFAKLRAHCEENGIPYRIGTQSDHGDNEFLLVDCGQDLQMAQGLARAIWTKVFGLSEHSRHRIQQYRVHMLGDVVDRPDQEPHSFKWGWLHRNGTGPPSLSALVLFGLLTMLRPIAFFGLLISLLSSVGEAPDWTLELGGMVLSGTAGSLVFFCLFLVGIWARLYFRTANRHPRTWFDAKILPIWGWIVIVTLPISSVLIWIGSQTVML
jgi:hypothetical protein